MDYPHIQIIDHDDAPAYVFHPLNFMPDGMYSISYDILTAATSNDLPHAWEAAPSKTYRQIIALLNRSGFRHNQYSMYTHENCDAFAAYYAMARLRFIQPPSKLATTLRVVRMTYVHDLAVCDMTNEMILGGFFEPTLRGPAPVGLVERLVANMHDDLFIPIHAIDPDHFVLPYGTRPILTSLLVENWCI